MSEVVHNTSHVSEGAALFTEAFRKGPNNQAILASWTSRIQEAEDALWSVLESRSLDDAVDSQLDLLGRIVQEPRKDRGDEDYRAAIRLRIRLLRSFGRTEDVIDIARLSTGLEPKYYDMGIAQFAIELFRLPSPEIVASFLARARAGGVDGYLIYTTDTAPVNTVMKWTDGVEETGGDIGWANQGIDINIPSVWASAEKL